MSNYSIYSDGAYSSKRDQGGIGIAVLKENKCILEYSKMYKHTSNNQMELGAIIIALRLIKKPISSLTIYTDSQYCIGGATLGWKRNKNIKLWQEFDKQYSRVKELCPNIQFIHVKGHSDNEWNNRIDQLARNASLLLN